MKYRKEKEPEKLLEVLWKSLAALHLTGKITEEENSWFKKRMIEILVENECYSFKTTPSLIFQLFFFAFALGFLLAVMIW